MGYYNQGRPGDYDRRRSTSEGDYGYPPHGPGRPPYGYPPRPTAYFPPVPPNIPTEPPSRTGPVVLTVLSAIALLLSPVFFALFLGFSIAMYEDSSLMGFELQHGETVEITEHKSFMIDPDPLETHSGDLRGIDCLVTRDGSPIEVERLTGERANEFNRGKFILKNTGEHSYTVSCEENDTAIPYVYVTHTNLSPGDFAFTIPIVLSILFGFLSLVGLIIGIIWLAKRNSQYRLYRTHYGWGSPYSPRAR